MTQETADSPILHKAVSNSIFSALGTISIFVLGFLFAGLKIRYLGVSLAGYLMTLQAVLGINRLAVGLGLEAPSIRRVSALHAQHDLSTARSAVGSVLTVSIVTAVLFSLPIVIFFPTIFTWARLDHVYQTDAFWATLFIAGSFLINRIAAPWRAVYQGLQRYDLITLLTTVFGAVSGVAGILVLIVIPSLTAIAVTEFVIIFAQLLCDAFFMRRLLGRVPLPTWVWSEVQPMLSFGGWAFLGRVGGGLLNNLDRLILTTVLGSAGMPYYVLPQNLYTRLHGALSHQCRFIFPMLSAGGERAGAQIERVDDRLRWFVAFVSAVGYSGLALIGPDILAKLVNEDFAMLARIPLTLACLQGFFHAQMIVPYYNSWAIGSGAPNASIEVINGVLVAMSALLLIPHFGYIGASEARLWICVLVVIHSLWVRRLIMPNAPSWNWLSAFTSPSLMIITWLGIVGLGIRFISPEPVWFYTLVALGGVVGLGVAWQIERFAFPTRARWTTLMRAANILLSRLRVVK